MKKNLEIALKKMSDVDFRELRINLNVAQKLRDMKFEFVIDNEELAEELGVQPGEIKKMLVGAYNFSTKMVAKVDDLRERLIIESEEDGDEEGEEVDDSTDESGEATEQPSDDQTMDVGSARIELHYDEVREGESQEIVQLVESINGAIDAIAEKQVSAEYVPGTIENINNAKKRLAELRGETVEIEAEEEKEVSPLVATESNQMDGGSGEEEVKEEKPATEEVKEEVEEKVEELSTESTEEAAETTGDNDQTTDDNSEGASTEEE